MVKTYNYSHIPTLSFRDEDISTASLTRKMVKNGENVLYSIRLKWFGVHNKIYAVDMMNSIPLNKRIKFNLQVCQYNIMKTCSVDKHNYINTFQRLCPPTNRLCNVYSNSIQFSNDYF